MADNSEKIEVYFKGSAPNDGQAPDLHWSPRVPSEQSAPASSDNSKGLVDIVVSGFAFKLGKTVVSSAMSRVGSYTGNYMAQNQINNMITGMGAIGVLATSFATMNMIPMITYVGAAALKAVDYQMQVTQANIQSQAIANLASVSATSRSRGAGGKI